MAGMIDRPDITSFVNPTSCAQLLYDPIHQDVDNFFSPELRPDQMVRFILQGTLYSRD